MGFAAPITCQFLIVNLPSKICCLKSAAATDCSAKFFNL